MNRDAPFDRADPRRRRSSKRLVAAAVALALGAAALAQISQLRVSQVHQVLDAERVVVRAYLDLAASGSGAELGLDPESLTATLGQEPLSLDRLEPMRGSGEGVAYIFLIDISRSLSQSEFDRIVGQIEAWIAGMTRADRAAILAFGESVRLVADFTGDREELAAALWSLGPTDDLTLLHRALVEALELAQRRDPDLPGRRALVVLTDGRDEGSGLTADDVLTRLRSDPAPVYAIGLSRLRNPEERRRYLDLLLRLASNSGGAFFEADRTEIADAYRQIRDAVQRVWLAELACADCPADGREYRFQITVSSDGRVLSDGQAVRIFPPRRRLAANQPVSPAPVDEEAAGEPAAGPSETVPSEETPRKRSWGKIVLITIGALAALLLLAILRRLLMGARTPADADDEERPEGANAETVERAGSHDRADIDLAGPGIDAPVPPPRKPPRETTPSASPSRSGGPLRPLRLIVVRGGKPGREYRLILQDRAVVGKRSTCDCVLVGEPDIEPEQFELIQRGGRVYINDLAIHSPTLLDGFPVEDNTPVESDHLIGTGTLILRVVFD